MTSTQLRILLAAMFLLPALRTDAAHFYVPPGVVHAYKNTSDVPGLVFNCPNRLYADHGRRQPVDEIRHEDLADSPFVLD